ncbi:MAG: formylglycine-generating enzyme family protein [Treponema sp.]|jgi:hypothetical protein|nr:formylglycine-generating enzyme family protein [Treponema sp.]
MLNKDVLLTGLMAASGGRLVVKYNAAGDPSVMVRIPKFNLEDIDASLGTGPHPAFIVNGVVKNEIFIGAFPAILENGCAVSIPGQTPRVNINFDNAKAACVANGPGWHLMTAWEWAAIALWCMKNDFQPRGNTQWGRAYEAAWETGVRPDGGNPGAASGDGKTLTGSGPVSWRHDNTLAGIADLVGNVFEWNDGLKLVDGRLYFPTDNYYSQPESEWPASSLCFDASAGPGDRSGAAQSGAPILSNAITKYSETPAPAGGGDTGEFDYANVASWKSVAVASGYDNLPQAARQQAAQLLIAPKLTSEGTALFTDIKGYLSVRNYGTRFPLRGGAYYVTSSAGLGALSLSTLSAILSYSVGFRPAFIL